MFHNVHVDVSCSSQTVAPTYRLHDLLSGESQLGLGHVVLSCEVTLDDAGVICAQRETDTICRKPRNEQVKIKTHKTAMSYHTELVIA